MSQQQDNIITTEEYTTTGSNNHQTLSSSSSPTLLSSKSSQPKLFTLPNGQLMDGKNTLQSFDVIIPSNTNVKNNTNTNKTTNDNIILPTGKIMNSTIATDTTTTTSNTDTPIVLHAVAVQSYVVADVEMQNDDVLQQTLSSPLPTKRSAMFWMVFSFGMIGILIIAGGVTAGLMIQSKNSKSSSSSSDTSTNQGPISINDSSSNTSSTSSLLLSLTVACNLLKYTNLTLCQEVKVFDGQPVGSIIPTEIGLLTQ